MDGLHILVVAEVVCLIGVLVVLVDESNAQNININLEKIAQIESGENRIAYNARTRATGLYQITPICREDYNERNGEQIAQDDLFDPAINEKVAKWYLQKRIPQLLRFYRKPITVRNVLIAYNAGIGYVVSGRTIPLETEHYIRKYFNQ